MQLHLKDKGDSLEDQNVHFLEREDNQSERKVKGAIYVMQETPTSNRGGVRMQLSKTYNEALGLIVSFTDFKAQFTLHCL